MDEPPSKPFSVSSADISSTTPQSPVEDEMGGGDFSFSDLGSITEIFESLDDDISCTIRSTSCVLTEQFHTSSSSIQKEDAPRLHATNTSNGFPTTASRTNVVQVNPNDVLLGRGGRNNQHSGNEQLRNFAREISSDYADAPKREKPAIAWILVTRIRNMYPPGRFLKQDDGGNWVEVDDDVAREKASQCLRDIVAAVIKNRKGGGEEQVHPTMTMSSSTPSLPAMKSTKNIMLPVVSSMSSQSLQEAYTMRQNKSFLHRQTTHLHSSAAQAGLAMLQRGTSNTGSDLTLRTGFQSGCQHNSKASLSGARMSLQRIHEASDETNNISSLNNSFGHAPMQISQNNLQLKSHRIPGEIISDRNSPAPISQHFLDRKRRTVSAPMLGDNSVLFSKRYRGKTPYSDMRNDTFTLQQDESLEPNQLNQLQQQLNHPRVASLISFKNNNGPRASSLMNLSGNGQQHINLLSQLQVPQQQVTSNSNATWNMVNNSLSSSGNVDWGGNPRDPNTFLQNLQEKSRCANPPTIITSSNNNNYATSMAPWGRSFPNASTASVLGNTSLLAQHAALASSSSCTVPLRQDGPKAVTATSNHLVGLGKISDGEGETALQRWIDRMAEEESGELSCAERNQY